MTYFDTKFVNKFINSLFSVATCSSPSGRLSANFLSLFFAAAAAFAFLIFARCFSRCNRLIFRFLFWLPNMPSISLLVSKPNASQGSRDTNKFCHTQVVLVAFVLRPYTYNSAGNISSDDAKEVEVGNRAGHHLLRFFFLSRRLSRLILLLLFFYYYYLLLLYHT